ncbi:protein FAR1-RELATED SEQUENCE 8-like isoform X1 [Coffea arabica]|uniref:Protein FAR1-RELATED SEQUENCE n=2 Tax=Coffea arabica TaxID=13443 RepID=A0A6P6X2K9_COFAR|nr:protein FAR1-RELATED SEQUENCE 8-like isoform X1 [Coffea arabica]
MTDDHNFPPADEGLSPNPDIEITMEGSSEDGEQLHQDEGSEQEIDGEEVFGFESTDLGDDSNQVLAIEHVDIANTADQMLGINRDDLENDKQVLDFERNGHDHNSEQMLEIQCGNLDNGIDRDTVIDDQNLVSGAKDYLPPVVGMEFESYDDAYNYYNCYAKELGFAIRVKSSWTKRNSKEKRGAVLCCNCEGFKTMKEASSRRKETRTGCLAMIRLRLVESNRWRVDEVKIEHNHPFDPERVQNCKSHKKMDPGSKRKLEPSVDVEVRTIKLYRTPVIDTVGNRSSNERESGNQVDQSKHLKLHQGEAEYISNFFGRLQLTNPNFFYVMDLNDEGHLRNVLWIDSRSRAAYGYFGDVVAIDTTCLSKSYNIPLLLFVGVDHHLQSILLACGLLVDETMETYIWLLRAWLSCMSGRPPQTVLTDRCKALQSAISEVFPRTHHRLYLPLVMQSILDKLEVGASKVFQDVLNRTVYNSLKADEFEMAWEEMIQHFGLRDHKWLQTYYEERERWAPVYLKDTFFAGLVTFPPGDCMSPFFDGYVNSQTTLKEFFNIYELVLQKKHQKEALDDLESRKYTPVLRTRCNYEVQLSEVYTKEIFLKFQVELELMSDCFNVTQIHANGPIITYVIKERDAEGDMNNARNFEVMYDKVGLEVRCICSCFNFRGYLCRHALQILTYNGIEDIPSQYILSRWRKDFKRLYAPDIGSNVIDVTNPVQWFDHLYRRAMQVVEEGMTSQDHYTVAWQAFKESLNKVRLVADRHVQ